ncbi:hypothetical protein O6H91_08G084900 [Diphasiastrum complanatum]|uniref:Uncharacterized protein n=1 Tax=Diphasiastrum complanatum TaxID=34168 RepID=A0ACC2CZH7_DIPCM|nr:hypothetical protein O6H91_08G084900 [Diphasiastrum complanatum]
MYIHKEDHMCDNPNSPAHLSTTTPSLVHLPLPLPCSLCHSHKQTYRQKHESYHSHNAPTNARESLMMNEANGSRVSLDADHTLIDMRREEELVNQWFTAAELSDIQPVKLTWRNLNVSLIPDRGEVHKILDDLTGYAEPGRLLAIMGPSGSGKSTLLDAFAGRLANSTVQTGDIYFNGHKGKASLGTSAYVRQEDTLLGTLTVRETILYSAWLRLPDDISNSMKRNIAEKTMREMGLHHCADEAIGNWHMRGVSGGEKRRVSIALELLVRPHLIYLDEPTSGLDSASAFFVMCKLKKLAMCGHTVLASIHQPSSEIFELLDDLLLLAKGKTVYFGAASGAQKCFSTAGFPCPALRNPSDHFLRAINSDFDTAKATLKEENLNPVDDPLNNINASEVIAILEDAYQNSEVASEANGKVEEMIQQKGKVLELRENRASFLTQLRVLTSRSFINMSRDIGYYWMRVVVYFAVALCLGTIYLNVGTTYESISARASCMFFAGAFLTFMSIGGFPSFTEDMKVFHHERLNGHYGVAIFILANTLSSLPFLILIAILSSAVAYNMAGLHPGLDRFVYFASCLLASLMVVESLMKAIASVIPDFLMGIILGAGIQGMFMLVCGFFRLLRNLPKPVWRYPMSYISFHTYTIQGMFQNDFLGLDFQNQNPNLPRIQGEFILTHTYGVDLGRSKTLNLVVLFGMVIAYSLLFFAMIKARDNVSWKALLRKLRNLRQKIK